MTMSTDRGNILIGSFLVPPPQEAIPTQKFHVLTPAGAIKKGKQKGKIGETSNSFRDLQPYAICEDFGHPTNLCPELVELKPLCMLPKH